MIPVYINKIVYTFKKSIPERWFRKDYGFLRSDMIEADVMCFFRMNDGPDLQKLKFRGAGGVSRLAANSISMGLFISCCQSPGE